MAKIIIDCADPNDLKKVESLVEQTVGKCNTTYFRQHQGMVEAGTSKSKSESARIIAEDLGESPGAVRKRIERGEKEIGQPVQEKPRTTRTIDNQESTTEMTPNLKKLEKTKKQPHGGKRDGAGRKRRPRFKITPLEEKEKIMDKYFKEGYELIYTALIEAIHFKWKTTTKEAAIKHLKILYAIVNYHCETKTTIEEGAKNYVYEI